MKRIKGWLLPALLVLCLCLSGCGASGDAESAFRTMMDDLRTGEEENINPYYDFQQDSRFLSEDVSEELYEMVADTLEEMEYTVESTEKIDGNTVQVTAKITTVDFSQVMNLYMEKLITMVDDANYQAQISGMAQEDYQKIIVDQMTEILEDEELGTMTKTVSVAMVKQEDGTWVPGENKEELFGALFLNLLDAVNSLI